MYNAFIKNKDFFIWDAVVAWRDHIYKADLWDNTKGNYLTNMLKMIELNIVNIHLKLDDIDDYWIKDTKLKVDSKPEWSPVTKSIRKSCLNSLYNFIKKDFNYCTIPHRRHPEPQEIKHILSSVKEKALTKDIVSPIVLCNELSKINKRDASIVWLMMYTGKTLESILDLKKSEINFKHIYIPSFKNFDKYLTDHIPGTLNDICKNSVFYLFETSTGKRIRRTQVTRNLKQAGRKIGLDFDLTPKVLHGYVCAYMSKDKRSELEIGLKMTIN